jgi:heme-degrading monooxygenase HmoA
VPFKHHAEHRHHIPKPRYRVTNWPEYDAALRRRGSLTVWITDEAIAAWRAEPRTTAARTDTLLDQITDSVAVVHG